MTERECVTAKRGWPTEHEARQALGAYRKTKAKHMPRCRVYECKACGGWHMTSRQKWTEPKPIGAWR